MDGATVDDGEHQARVLPARPHGQALLELASPVSAERCHRRRVDGDASATLNRLRLGEGHHVVDDGKRLHHAQRPVPSRRACAQATTDRLAAILAHEAAHERVEHPVDLCTGGARVR
ncbi:MAG: hypothetical protein M3R01_01440, partial [Actinomycetota bacterium]|nr:hypothetical protein [Actinomycetota bacterium]